MSLQKKLHAHFHVGTFMLIRKLLWHPPRFVIPAVLMNDGICVPQLMSNLSAISVPIISLSSWTRALTVQHCPPFVKWSDGPSGRPQRCLFCHSESFPPTGRYAFLCVMQFSSYCANILMWISEGFIPPEHKNWMTERSSTMLQSESRRNGYLTTCLDLAQYVVRVMSARAQCDELPGFTRKFPLLFEFPSYFCSKYKLT